MVEDAFFITGSTGLLGTEVVTQLLTTTNSKIYVLVRAASEKEATYRLQTLWWEDNVLSAAISKRIMPVVGDITQPLTGIPDDITHVIHCAAETGIQKSKEEY